MITAFSSSSLSSSSSSSSSSSGVIKIKRSNAKGITIKIALDRNGNVAPKLKKKKRLQITNTDHNNKNNNNERFTSSESLTMVHRLRRDSDAVLVGRGTVQVDDPSLTVRRVPPLIQRRRRRRIPKGEPKQRNEKEEKVEYEYQSNIIQPLRVVLDPSLSILRDEMDGNYAILHNDNKIEGDDKNNGKTETIVYYDPMRVMSITSSDDDESFLFEPILGVSPVPMFNDDNYDDFDNDNHHPQSNNKKGKKKKKKKKGLSPLSIMNDLIERANVQHLMVEGGPNTIKRFLEEEGEAEEGEVKESIVDRVIVIRAVSISFDDNEDGTTTGGGIPSNINDDVLKRAGLLKIGTGMCGKDIVEKWSRPGLPWPIYEGCDDNDKQDIVNSINIENEEWTCWP